MKMNKLSKYDDMKKFFLNNEIVDNISQYAENNVKNVNNNNKKNEGDIINDEKKKEKRKNNNNEKMSHLVDNLNHINNQIFNDIVES